MYYLKQTFYVVGLSITFLAFTILLFSLSVQAESIQIDSEPAPDDQFELFVEKLLAVTDIKQLQTQKLAKGESTIQPWSGSYWPIHKGILSQRYADPQNSSNKIFIQNYSEFQRRSSDNYVISNQIQRLSAAEKYDLLIGDTNWTLSKKMWEKGLKSFEDFGMVATWTGICHGWAAASHRLEISPHQTVKVMDATGRYEIPFYSSDIKGLVSLLWAASSSSSFRAGNRCRGPKIRIDPYLRPLDISCLDSNPKTWHIALTNRMGINKKSMVMDSAAGPEVWNYPITSYDYHYFDPKTLKPTHHLESALRLISSLPKNHLTDFRSSQAEYLVGIIMEIQHPALTEPTILVGSKVVMSKKTYIYDLELNGNFQIVGGEWLSEAAPDFIWTFPAVSQATTREDLNLKLLNITWNSQNPVPEMISAGAKIATRRGEVLSTIVNELLSRSQVNTN